MTQVAQVQYPRYGTGQAGHSSFTRDVIARLMTLGLGFVPAQLFTAHLARETGWGQYVWNGNFGNIKAYSGWTGPTYVLTDRLGYTDNYRSYNDATQGLADDVALIRDHARYAGAWQQLQSGDPNWYSTLGIEGYFEGPSDPNQPGVHQPTTADNVGPAQDEYNQVLALVQQYVPSAPIGAVVMNLLPRFLTAGFLGLAAFATYKVWQDGDLKIPGLPQPKKLRR